MHIYVCTHAHLYTHARTHTSPHLLPHHVNLVLHRRHRLHPLLHVVHARLQLLDLAPHLQTNINTEFQL